MKEIRDIKLENDEILENTHNALRDLILNTLSKQNTLTCKHCISPMSFYKEYCTVKITGARQIGHTSALVRAALEFSKNALILSPNIHMCENGCKLMVHRFSEHLKEFDEVCINKYTKYSVELTDGSKYSFLPLQSYIGRIEHCEDLDAVFIDCTYRLTAAAEEALYKNVGTAMRNSEQKLFVFVQ